MKRISEIYDDAQESSQSEFIDQYPHPVLVVTQIHEGSLAHRPPDHEATVSHRRLPWADSAPGLRTARRRGSLGQYARATMHHEGGEEDHEINLAGLFEEQEDTRLPELGPKSRFVALKHGLDSGNQQLVLGRSSSCDVVINDYSISKSHARIAHDAYLKRTMVTDLGSRNGTFMDEHRLEKGRPTLIRSGDEVRLGRLSFAYLEAVDLYTALTATS